MVHLEQKSSYWVGWLVRHFSLLSPAAPSASPSTHTTGAESHVSTPAASQNMAIQSNLDYQTFWAPRPSSRPRYVDGQSHIRPLPQPKSSPLPLNDSRGMMGVSKLSADSSPRLASSTDDVVYISDDAASDMNDASHEPFDESLPSIQAIVQSLEDAEKMGNTDDTFEQPPQRKDAHEASSRSADPTPPEQEPLNESQRPTVDIAAECSVGVSASASRMCTSAPTLMADGSRIGSSYCDSSLRVSDSQHARGSSSSADHEGTEKPSLSEIPQRLDSQLRLHSSVSQPQQPPSPPDDDCTRVGMTLRELPSPSQRASTKEASFDVFDTALCHTSISCDQSSDEALPSVRTAVRSLEETGEIRNAVVEGEQASNSGYECEPFQGPSSSPLLDRGKINHSAGPSLAEPADCLTEAPSSISQIRCLTALTRASSRLNSLSPESQVWDTVSTQTSCTSMSAPGNDEVEIDDQICAGTTTSEKAANAPSEREYTYDEEPTMIRMPLGARKKRSRASFANHGAEQFEVGGLHGASDDPDYCPAPGDESEAGSDSLSSGKEQASRKRRKFRAQPSKNNSQGQESAHSILVGLDQASEPVSATHWDAVAKPTEAAFDEWTLRDVVLKRTVMDGKATFVFQFDWDLCAQHGDAPREPCKRPKQQSKAKPVVKNNGRRRFTALEDRWLVTWKEEQGLCWADIHSHFCVKFGERSKEALQVRYCTRLKQRDNDGSGAISHI